MPVLTLDKYGGTLALTHIAYYSGGVLKARTCSLLLSFVSQRRVDSRAPKI